MKLAGAGGKTKINTKVPQTAWMIYLYIYTNFGNVYVC